MASSLLTALITSLGQSLPGTLAGALSGTSTQVSQLQSLVGQLEANADNPDMAGQFAHDIAVMSTGFPLVQVTAVKIWSQCQSANRATYNPMMVMAEAQMMQGQLAQANSGFLTGLGSLFGAGATLTIPGQTIPVS